MITQSELNNGLYIPINSYVTDGSSTRKKRRLKYMRKLKLKFIQWCKSSGYLMQCILCENEIKVFYGNKSSDELITNTEIVIMCSEAETINFRRGDIVFVCKLCIDRHQMKGKKHYEKIAVINKLIKEYPDYVSSKDITKNAKRLSGSFGQKDN